MHQLCSIGRCIGAFVEIELDNWVLISYHSESFHSNGSVDVWPSPSASEIHEIAMPCTISTINSSGPRHFQEWYNTCALSEHEIVLQVWIHWNQHFFEVGHVLGVEIICLSESKWSRLPYNVTAETETEKVPYLNIKSRSFHLTIVLIGKWTPHIESNKQYTLMRSPQEILYSMTSPISRMSMLSWCMEF